MPSIDSLRKPYVSFPLENRNIACRVQDTINFDSIWQRTIKNNVVADGDFAQVHRQIGTSLTDQWLPCQHFTLGRDLVEETIRDGGVVSGDVTQTSSRSLNTLRLRCTVITTSQSVPRDAAFPAA